MWQLLQVCHGSSTSSVSFLMWIISALYHRIGCDSCYMCATAANILDCANYHMCFCAMQYYTAVTCVPRQLIYETVPIITCASVVCNTIQLLRVNNYRNCMYIHVPWRLLRISIPWQPGTWGPPWGRRTPHCEPGSRGRRNLGPEVSWVIPADITSHLLVTYSHND